MNLGPKKVAIWPKAMLGFSKGKMKSLTQVGDQDFGIPLYKNKNRILVTTEAARLHRDGYTGSNSCNGKKNIKILKY